MHIQSAHRRLTTQLPLKTRQNQLPSQLKQLHQFILVSFLQQGAPPTHDEMAAQLLKTDVSEALRLLGTLDLVVLKPDDCTVLGAYPVTHETTPHQLSIGAHKIYAMCALDAVSVAPLVSLDVSITSNCHLSGEPIRIQMRGQHVLAATPRQIMVGIRWQMPNGTAAHSMCTEMVFLKDLTTARNWSQNKDSISLFNLVDAIALGKAFFKPLLEP